MSEQAVEQELPETQLWIVGQVPSLEGSANNEWQFAGVFSSEKLAIEACRTDNYFIGPAKLDAPLPHETFDWPGAYYPHFVEQDAEK